MIIKIEKEKLYGRASINAGKYFLKLIDKHFNHDNILHKIFNWKTLKISYSCTKNSFQIINDHNREIIKESQNRTNNNNNNNNNNSKQNRCNCKTRNDCPMNGLWNLNNVVYQEIIYPNENINDRKIILEFPPRNGKLDKLNTNILSPMNIWNIKLLYLSILGFEK